MYIWETLNWPDFSWEERNLAPLLTKANREQGRLLGNMEALGFEFRNEVNLQNMTQEVVASGEIEGESLDAAQVRSSIARRLGLDIAGLVAADRNVESVVEMMLDATQNYADPLTDVRLFAWHTALFPTLSWPKAGHRAGAVWPPIPSVWEGWQRPWPPPRRIQDLNASFWPGKRYFLCAGSGSSIPGPPPQIVERSFFSQPFPRK